MMEDRISIQIYYSYYLQLKYDINFNNSRSTVIIIITVKVINGLSPTLHNLKKMYRY